MKKLQHPNKHRLQHRFRTRQQGAVAVIVGVTLAVLIGAGGLALDLGRLYINKTELQTSADACALAAASELICPGTAGGCAVNALNAGRTASQQNTRDFQRSSAQIADMDIELSLNYTSGYVAAGSAPNNSKFARCTARATGIVPWLIGVLGVGASNVASSGVATLGPGASVCPDAPIGVCPRTGGGNYNVGDWIVASHNDSTGHLGNSASPYGTAVKGTFRWVDWDYPGGGTNEVRDRLAGATTCGINSATANIAEPGDAQGAKSAYNTRFGIYPNGGGPNGYDVTNAPPDRTGWSYPMHSTSVGTSAFGDYMTRYGNADPFNSGRGRGGGRDSYDTSAVQQGNAPINGDYATREQHRTRGSHRRLITVPLVDGCSGVGSAKTVVSWGCFLMLNPMGNGNSSDVFLEYRGAATATGSPCASGGGPGGPGSNAGLVPVLVQ